MSAVGTFACPICGEAHPHHHNDSVVAAWREDQCRADGWTSPIVRLPPTRGFYLCSGHKLEPRDDADEIARQFIIDRAEAQRGGFPAEVLEYESGRFWLLHMRWVSRYNPHQRTFYVWPKLWHPLPAIGSAAQPSSNERKP